MPNDIPSLQVAVVDDDDQIRSGIQRLLESAGIRVAAYNGAKGFLKNGDLTQTGCIVLDVRMPEMSGLQLHRLLIERGNCPPVIILTAFAETQMIVEEMKAGAFDFMDKPFRSEALLQRVQDALRLESERKKERVELRGIKNRLKRLSPREMQLLQLLVEANTIKEIAYELGISETTVHFHQRNLFEKMEVENTVRLTRLISDYQHLAHGQA